MKSVTPHRSFKSAATGWCAAQIVRLLSWTLRVRVIDKTEIRARRNDEPVIWIFWHNRILGLPAFYKRYLPHRRISVLTSASRDGAVLEKVVGCFGIGSVRGSSSKRGALALAELCSAIESGRDAGITPDGPRGPCYRLAPGTVKLAQLTGSEIYFIKVRYEKSWRLKSWDRFFVPKPFSRVLVTLEACVGVDRTATGDAFEAERLRLESMLAPEPDDL